MTQWRKERIVPNDKVEILLKVVEDDFRKRTQDAFPLPEDESCQFEFVTDKPWSGYNWFLGDCSSRIDINTDVPIYIFSLPSYVSHEAYTR